MAEKQDTEDKIIPVGPGADEDDSQGTPPEGARAGEDYQYPEGEDGEDTRVAAGDERAGHSEEGDEPEGGDGLTKEQRRRRRRQERHQRDQRELAFLRSRNEQLEREQSRRLAALETRQTQSDVLTIDGRISQAENDIREAETLYTQARRANDPDAEIEALRVRDSLRDGLRQLQAVKQNAVRTGQERHAAATAPQESTMPPEAIARGRDWARDNPWYDPQLRDEDSSIAFVIERRLFNEGRLDPTTDEYWDEYNRRLAKRLPEHVQARREDDDDEDEDDDRTRRNGGGRNERRPVNGNGQRKPSGPTFKVGGRERTLRKGEVFIDEDRKQAMIEKGVWDDPVLRDRQLKYYQQYDREAGRRPR